MGLLSVQCGKLRMAATSWSTGMPGTLYQGVGWRDMLLLAANGSRSLAHDSPQNMPIEEQDTDIIPTAAHSITPGQYTASLDIALQ